MAKEKTCECCGREFTPKGSSTTRRCPECSWSRPTTKKKTGGAVSESDTKKKATSRKRSQLDENVARAAEYGISYGKYMQLKDKPHLLEAARRAADSVRDIANDGSDWTRHLIAITRGEKLK